MMMIYSVPIVKSQDGLKLLIVDKDGNFPSKTSRLVHKEVFGDL
ncbi:hypothetical protein HanRHA438_Chr02g0060791 [Helianthus annuus]|nr:hypothetical protein HanRHA438_Chr02g0060791 [Helianthus annuus]